MRVGLKVAAHIFYLAGREGRARRRRRLHRPQRPGRRRSMTRLSNSCEARDRCLSPTLMRDVSTFVYESRPAFFDDPFFKREVPVETIAGLQTPEYQASNRTAAATKYQRRPRHRQGEPQTSEGRRRSHRDGHRYGPGGAIPGLLRAPRARADGCRGADADGGDRRGDERCRAVHEYRAIAWARCASVSTPTFSAHGAQSARRHRQHPHRSSPSWIRGYRVPR